jgi:glycosyltransferase involved in cell wall biosynthesis
MENKITLIANYLNDNQKSMQNYSSFLQAGLEAKNWQVNLVRPQAFLGKLRSSSTGIGKWFGYVDKYLIFSFILRQTKANFFHICDQGNAIYSQYLQDKNHLVTCHDVLAIRSALGEIPQNPTSWTGKQYQALILNGLNQAKHVVCVSHKTREELLAISTLQPEQTSVIHNSLNYPFRQLSPEESAQRLSSRPEFLNLPFVLHVGDNKWYKNRSGLLRIFAHYRHLYPESDLHLLLAGRPLSKELKQLKDKLNLNDSIIEWISPTTEQLEALYSTAQALLFPSLHEGFGLPIIEAQACGCPVVCTSNGPLPEVAGNGALMAPADEEELAQLLAKVIHSSNTRTELVKKGLENAERFTSDKIVNAYVQLYTNLAY